MLEIKNNVLTIARIKQHIIDWANEKVDLESSVDIEHALTLVPFAREIYLYGCGYTVEELCVPAEELHASLRLLATLLKKEDYRWNVPVVKQYMLILNSSLHTHEIINE